jgi:hypothetical protein
LSGKKKIASLYLSLFFFPFSDVGQMHRWSSGDVPCRVSVHLSSEFEGEGHPCNVVPINTSIKIHCQNQLFQGNGLPYADAC